MPIRHWTHAALVAALLSPILWMACDDSTSETPADTVSAQDTTATQDVTADTGSTPDADTVSGGADSAQDAGPSADVAPETTATADVPADVPTEPAGPTWHGEISQFMVTYCVECHDSGSKDFRSLASVIAKKSPIRCGVAPTAQPGCGSWPPPNQFPIGNGPQPSVAERQMIVDWVDAGTPEGTPQ